jgi:hypothetical protein
MDNGFVDHIVTRHDMRAHLAKLLHYLAPNAEEDIASYVPPTAAMSEPAAEVPAGEEDAKEE